MSIYKSFLELGGKRFEGKRSSFKRGKPLLAFDLKTFTRSGDHDDKDTKIEILKELLPHVYATANTFGVDIAVCIPEEEAYVSAQALRDECCPLLGGPFWMLTETQKANALDLAEAAMAGRLSVFVGAGISIPSGAPSWGGLLESLAIKAGLDEDDRQSLSVVDFLDQPTILARVMKDEFKPAVADIIKKSSRYTPGHAILKTLKKPAITTNYDNLYELAAESCNDYLPTLPWKSREMIERNHLQTNSLLKLHGCVNYPETIILSRGDYMRYPDTCQALRGRLHGIFLTSEVLFCGFSMTDDNVHKVIDDVRKVLYVDDQHNDQENKLGTILTMTENKLFNRLWDEDFNVVSFGRSWADNPSWYHDCFLDFLVTSYIQSKS